MYKNFTIQSVQPNLSLNSTAGDLTIFQNKSINTVQFCKYLKWFGA